MRVSSQDAKEWAREHVRGQWMCPQIAFDESFALDEDGIRQTTNHCLAMEAGGIGYTVLMEPWSCTTEERMRGAAIMIDEVDSRIATYVNVTDHSVPITLALADHALSSGATAVLINCPYEWAKSETLMIDWFKYVCAGIDGPVFLYNTPHSGFVFSPEAVAEVAAIPNICTLKNAVGDFHHTERVFELVGDQIVVCDPFEEHYLDAITGFGQQALVATTASHLMQTPTWQPIRDYAQLAQNGEIEQARALYDQLAPLRKLWADAYANVKDIKHAEHPFAITKYWQACMGMSGGAVRPPLHQITEEWKERVRNDLRPFAERFGLDSALFDGRMSEAQVAVS